MNVLVTGATGFVGRAVLPRLLAAGHRVRAAVRRPTAELPADVEAVVVGDIDGDTDWGRAFAVTDASIDAVVHLAARVHVMRDEAQDPLAEFRRVNRDGTRKLAAACRGIQRFVLMSSIKAQVDEVTAAPVDEDTPPVPTSPYGISKLEAEHSLAEAAALHGYRWIALRPPLVFGEGVGGNFRRMMGAVRRGLPLPLGAVHNRRSLIYVGNLADAVVRALDPAAPSGLALPVTDGPPRATAAVIRALASAMGRRAPLIPVPASLLAAGARLLHRQDLWSRLGGDLEIAESVRGRLGWAPTVGFDEAIQRTAAAFLAASRA